MPTSPRSNSAAVVPEAAGSGPDPGGSVPARVGGRVRGAILGLLGLLCGVVGCEIFRDRPSLFRAAEKKFASLKAAPDSIQFEIVFLERPVGDRLLGEELWRDVDQILGLEPEAQRELERNGFRVGVAGSHPPEALQAMLELKSGLGASAGPDDTEKLTGNRVFVRPGNSTEIEVSPTYPQCQVTVQGPTKGPAGEIREFDQARCVFRMTAYRDQEGWARLDFVPEIHHGPHQLRPNAGTDAWQLISSQKIEKLYGERFSVMLNVGDMALVTARENSVNSVGHLFFVGHDPSASVQRLLLVRLAHLPSSSAAP